MMNTLFFGRRQTLTVPEQKSSGSRLPNRPRDPLVIMRNALCELISEIKLSADDRSTFLDFIRTAPKHVIDDICTQLIANVRTAERLNWQAKLEEYFDSEPPKYETHKQNYLNAPDFLKEVWGDYIRHGVLYLDRLSKYDDKLIPAVRRHWQLHGRDDDDVDTPTLPPPRPARTKAILEHFAATTPYGMEEIIRAALAENRRRQRHQTLG